jgi:hypothetical protein
MKSLRVQYDKAEDKFTFIKEQSKQEWVDVCERFDNDVHRLRDETAHPPYTGLYECFDEHNHPAYYLVEENAQLRKIRQQVFLSKLGR